jgi:hypothetical protein
VDQRWPWRRSSVFFRCVRPILDEIVVARPWGVSAPGVGAYLQRFWKNEQHSVEISNEWRRPFGIVLVYDEMTRRMTDGAEANVVRPFYRWTGSWQGRRASSLRGSRGRPLTVELSEINTKRLNITSCYSRERMWWDRLAPTANVIGLEEQSPRIAGYFKRWLRALPCSSGRKKMEEEKCLREHFACVENIFNDF